jgi:hypothetical protein
MAEDFTTIKLSRSELREVAGYAVARRSRRRSRPDHAVSDPCASRRSGRPEPLPERTPGGGRVGELIRKLDALLRRPATDR